MKAVVLAAGYATRLRPLTDTTPKHLLPLAGRPMLDWLLDKIRDLDEVVEVHLVTNSRFALDFRRWGAANDVTVHDDGTTSNQDRLGAVGDLQLAISAADLADDELLVLAGDNLFDLDLTEFELWWRRHAPAGSAVALYDCGDLELACQYGIVATDDDQRIVEFVEKPTEPPSTLAATVIYLLPPEHVRMVGDYLAAGNPPDNAGSFIAWLARRRPVYGYEFDGVWHDIGDHDQLVEADNRLRRRHSLEERNRYALD